LHLNAAQLAGDTLFLRETADVEPCPAELIITIDEKVVRETIILPRGISKGVTEVEFFWADTGIRWGVAVVGACRSNRDGLGWLAARFVLANWC
jgi:hypothetical protein